MGKKISDKMAAASRNDASPILGVLLELVSLERIDLVADEASNRHRCPLDVRFLSQLHFYNQICQLPHIDTSFIIKV